MYDNEPVPGRNEPCWCGSGKKYKKCHAAIDERLQECYLNGQEVIYRHLLKTPEDIEGIKRSAAINVGVLDMVGERIAPGVTTAEVDQWIYDYTVEHGGIPADLNYEGFPKSVCTSINDVVCHGIPSERDVLREGDIVNVDCSTILDGYFSDSSRMFCIGEVSPERKKLVDVTRESIQRGLAQRRTASTWCASLAATALARSSTRIRSWPTWASRARAWCSRRACASRSSRW